jgi:hypothetical protein
LNTAPDVVPLRRLQEEWKTTLVLNDPLTSQNGMISACKDHVEDTGPLNITGNVGSEDKLTPEYRVDKYGLATGVS